MKRGSVVTVGGVPVPLAILNSKAAFDKEIARLKTLNPQSPDFATELNYAQTLLDLPWNTCTDDDFTTGADGQVCAWERQQAQKASTATVRIRILFIVSNYLRP